MLGLLIGDPLLLAARHNGSWVVGVPAAPHFEVLPSRGTCARRRRISGDLDVEESVEQRVGPQRHHDLLILDLGELRPEHATGGRVPLGRGGTGDGPVLDGGRSAGVLLGGDLIGVRHRWRPRASGPRPGVPRLTVEVVVAAAIVRRGRGVALVETAAAGHPVVRELRVDRGATDLVLLRTEEAEPGGDGVSQEHDVAGCALALDLRRRRLPRSSNCKGSQRQRCAHRNHPRSLAASHGVLLRGWCCPIPATWHRFLLTPPAEASLIIKMADAGTAEPRW